MAALSCQFHFAIRGLPRNARIRPSFSCSVQPSQSNIKDLPSPDAVQIAKNLSNLGQIDVVFTIVAASGVWPGEISVDF